jgi:predicted enzyme related to lactoylglutathione lyase
MSIARLADVVLECRDPRALAAFYTAVTGWKQTDDDPRWCTLSDGGGVTLSFQQAPGHSAPIWPDDGSSMQYHLDLMVDDLDRAEAEVLALGATKLAHQPGTRFRVFADPAGHVFCLCV